ncbi:hypothetical protein PISMIDRAFT_393087 [Pisolithus microcarpus 441]|uniref:Uncharacterized protein n=1 Tax=Pisolithus microcarpus 441 TaxID=765257 RepID=A0A0C9ZLI7_9AGAM|nr:hypothetical protein PISMIDRAFT_393087 [Pisolithus microcarpus 441]
MGQLYPPKYHRLICRQRVNWTLEPRQNYTHRIQPILDFMGNRDIPSDTTSNARRERGHEERISLTYDKVSGGFTRQSNTVSQISLAATGAQRVVSKLN